MSANTTPTPKESVLTRTRGGRIVRRPTRGRLSNPIQASSPHSQASQMQVEADHAQHPSTPSTNWPRPTIASTGRHSIAATAAPARGIVAACNQPPSTAVLSSGDEALQQITDMASEHIEQADPEQEASQDTGRGGRRQRGDEEEENDSRDGQPRVEAPLEDHVAIWVRYEMNFQECEELVRKQKVMKEDAMAKSKTLEELTSKHAGWVAQLQLLQAQVAASTQDLFRLGEEAEASQAAYKKTVSDNAKEFQRIINR